MFASLGLIACFARGFAIVFRRMLADFLCGCGGSSGFLLGRETPVISAFRFLILPSLSRGRTGIRPLASVSPRGGNGPWMGCVSGFPPEVTARRNRNVNDGASAEVSDIVASFPGRGCGRPAGG